MACSFRRAIRLGPLRVNLSKRGVGLSAGVPVARSGVDATGMPYVAGGRRGLYFRERVRPEQELTDPGVGRRVAWILGVEAVRVVLAVVWVAVRGG